MEMKLRWRWITPGILATGLLALFAWGRFPSSKLLTLSFILLGLGMLSAGAETLLLRRVRLLEWLSYQNADWSSAALPWSLVFLLIGTGLVYAGVVRTFGWGSPFLAYLQRRPGAALIGIGLSLLGAGTATSIGPLDWRTSFASQLIHIPHRVLGIFMLLIGLAAIMLGAFELFAPQAFDAWIRSALGLFTANWL